MFYALSLEIRYLFVIRYRGPVVVEIVTGGIGNMIDYKDCRAITPKIEMVIHVVHKCLPNMGKSQYNVSQVELAQLYMVLST